MGIAVEKSAVAAFGLQLEQLGAASIVIGLAGLVCWRGGERLLQGLLVL